ncbi:MAG: hypothetical protein E6J90_52780 [Deltaproteobacteria bacterium]|nr:MAG: hypothetical protein E6J90_52780 [Deltaproteobacteria bacterium]TMQ14772.1 MAG: hypothetical protein E6J91_14600 [Deltaproteobacteria bacterium]
MGYPHPALARADAVAPRAPRIRILDRGVAARRRCPWKADGYRPGRRRARRAVDRRVRRRQRRGYQRHVGSVALG